MLRDRIIKDLDKTQSCVDPIAQRLGVPIAEIERELKAMLVEDIVHKSLIMDFLPVYRLTEKTRQSLHS